MSDHNMKLGDLVYHKATEQPMVVIGFPKDPNNLTAESVDRTKVICRFFSQSSGKYEEFTFHSVEFRS